MGPWTHVLGPCSFWAPFGPSRGFKPNALQRSKLARWQGTRKRLRHKRGLTELPRQLTKQQQHGSACRKAANWSWRSYMYSRGISYMYTMPSEWFAGVTTPSGKVGWVSSLPVCTLTLAHQSSRTPKQGALKAHYRVLGTSSGNTKGSQEHKPERHLCNAAASPSSASSSRAKPVKPSELHTGSLACNPICTSQGLKSLKHKISNVQVGKYIYSCRW